MKNSQKNLIRREKRKKSWQGHHKDIIPSNMLIFHYLSTLQLVSHPRPKAYKQSSQMHKLLFQL